RRTGNRPLRRARSRETAREPNGSPACRPRVVWPRKAPPRPASLVARFTLLPMGPTNLRSPRHKRSSCLHGRLDSNGSRTLGRASISFNYTHNEYTLPGVPRKALTRNVVSGKGLSPPHAQKRADHEADGGNLQAEINRRMDDGNAGRRDSHRGQIAVSAPAARCAPEAYDP